MRKQAQLAGILAGLTWLALSAPPAHAMPLQFRADPPATWWWLLNALAGDPHVETAQWRKSWQEQGLSAPDDAVQWQRFAEVRDRYRGPYLRPANAPATLVPVPPPPSSRLEVRLAMAFLSSRTLDEAFGKAEVLLQPRDLGQLRAVFAHLQPRLDQYWRGQGWLAAWNQRFATWAVQQDVPRLLDDVARLFGLAPQELLGLRVHFVPAPRVKGDEKSANLHGRRLGTDMVVEVRERDPPQERADVVVHEASHALEELADLAGDATLLSALLAEPTGPRAWELLDEALATAIGQGLAAQRWDPKFAESLTRPKSWYVDDAIDPFAKALYPLVKKAVAEGTTLRASAPNLVRAWQTVKPVETPRLHLGRAVRISSDEAVFGPMQSALGAGASWRGVLGEAGSLAQRYPAATLVVAATWAELPELQGQLKNLGLPEARELRRSQSGLWIKRRPAGGCVFLVMAKDAQGLREALVVLTRLNELREGWQALAGRT